MRAVRRHALPFVRLITLLTRSGSQLRRLLGDRSGNVLIFTALGIMALIGAAGLGTEAASWYASKRNMQNAADEGAQGGIKSLFNAFINWENGINVVWATERTYARHEAQSATAWHGYADGSNNTTITINIQPDQSVVGYPSPTYDNKVVEVYVSQPSDRLFSNIFLTTQQSINARAVAIIDLSKADCLLALNPTTGKAMSAQGSVTVNAPCGAAVASNSSSGFSTTGGSATITLGNLRVGGSGVDDHNGDLGKTPVQYNETITDPYNVRVMPTLASGFPTGSTYPGNDLQTVTYPTKVVGAFGSGYTVSGSQTTASVFGAGTDCTSGCVFKGGLTLSTGATLTLSSGVYFVDKGNLSIGNASLNTSAGATVILTDSTATTSTNSVGVFNMQSTNSTVTLLAPSNKSGDPGYGVINYGNNNSAYSSYASLAGIALMQDRLATESTVKNNGDCNTDCSFFSGGSSSRVTGAFYFPQGNITWQGTPTSTNCFQLIADTLTLAGTATVSLATGGCTQGEILGGPQIAHLAE